MHFDTLKEAVDAGVVFINIDDTSGNTFVFHFDEDESSYAVICEYLQDGEDKLIDWLEENRPSLLMTDEQELEHHKKDELKKFTCGGRNDRHIRFCPGIYSNKTPLYTYNVTYTRVTQESASIGDFESSGFKIEDESGTLGEIVEMANQFGIEPRSSTDGTNWWESEGNQDPLSGATTEFGLHLKKMDGTNIVQGDVEFDLINVALGGVNLSVARKTPGLELDI